MTPEPYDWWLIIPACMCPNSFYDHKTGKTRCELPGKNYWASCKYERCEMAHIVPPKPNVRMK
jgi:hypothetical protein